MPRKRVLVTVKTYPTLSQSHVELVCTAGFREDGSWVRIYPPSYGKAAIGPLRGIPSQKCPELADPIIAALEAVRAAPKDIRQGLHLGSEGGRIVFGVVEHGRVKVERAEPIVADVKDPALGPFLELLKEHEGLNSEQVLLELDMLPTSW